MTRTTRKLTAAVLAATTTFLVGFGATAAEPLRVAQPLRVAGEAIRTSPQVPQAPAAIGGLAIAPIGPDLVIQSYAFVPTNDKGLRIQVRNAGNQGSSTHLLRLTVRRINGTPVGRTMETPVPAMNGNDSRWVTLDTSSILPVSVAIADTGFRLDADAGEHVAETDEDNNRTWHNL